MMLAIVVLMLRLLEAREALELRAPEGSWAARLKGAAKEKL